MLRNGTSWRSLPVVYGSRATVHRRFQEWSRNGSLRKVWAVLLQLLDDKSVLDWSQAFIDGSFVEAKRGSGVGKTGCGKGSRWIVIAEGNRGLPIAIRAFSARPGEIRLAEPTMDSIAHWKKPQRLIGDKAYYSKKHREYFRSWYACELIAKPKRHYKNSPQDGRFLRRLRGRWKVERLNAWIKSFRRTRIRFERKVTNFEGFLILACIVIGLRHL